MSLGMSSVCSAVSGAFGTAPSEEAAGLAPFVKAGLKGSDFTETFFGTMNAETGTAVGKVIGADGFDGVLKGDAEDGDS